MRKSKFTESQIVATLKEVEGGQQVEDVCRELGISEATCYVWKTKYGGMGAGDVQWLRELEAEHNKLKRMYAELAMKNHALRDVIAKSCRPCAQAPARDVVVECHGWIERRAYMAIGLSRSTAHYRRRPDRDEEVIALLVELLERFPERGFGKLFQLIRRRGRVWNHKRVWRVYCLMRLNRRRCGKRRISNRSPQPLVAGKQINRSWSVDFMSDALWDGRRFRTFNVIDDFSREALAIEVAPHLPAARVIRTFSASPLGAATRTSCTWPTAPSSLRWRWPNAPRATLDFIEPGRPMQNGFIEAFNGSYRRGVLNMHVFRTLSEMREHTGRWLADYNQEISRDSLDGLTPAEFRIHIHNYPETSNLAWH